MIGTNLISMNQATMKQIVQDWYDRVAPNLQVRVTNVRCNSTADLFEVTVQEKGDLPDGVAEAYAYERT